MWFESLLGKDVAKGANLFDLLATQKRKNLTIEGLIERGLIKPDDIHPADIIASYSRRKGRDFALLDLRDAAVKDGMARLKPKKKIILEGKGYKYKPEEGWVNAPPRAKILKDYELHPAFAEAVDGMLKFNEYSSNWDRFMGITKMTAFYNPFFLPMYDTVQGAMLGSMRSIKTPKCFSKAVKDVWNRSGDYYTALDNGLASKPFNNPFNSWKSMLEHIKRSKGERVFNVLKTILPQNTLKNIYSASWHYAWKMDETIRMTSYNYLIDKGFSPREAAQIAAKFHADYASVPAKTRKMLNKVLFTPTFKITMGKLYGQMMTDAVKSAGKFGKVDKTTKVFGKGLVATAAILETWDLFMRSMGFECDEWGRRYAKTVETEDGPKQLVITWSSPANMFLKYLYRGADVAKPGVENPLMSFLERNKWEFHPVYRTAWEIVHNDNGIGDKIWSEFDTDFVKWGKRAKYAFSSIVRVVSILDEQPSNKEARKKFSEETSKLFDLVTQPFTFKYMRNTEEQRTIGKIRQLQKRFKTELIRKIYKGEQVDPDWIKGYQNQVDEILKESQ